MFVDEVKIYVRGGDGGNGCVSLHHEIYRPNGGPDGGNAGHGGNVILEGTRSLNNLGIFKKRVHIKAERGQHGKGNNKFGKNAVDTIVSVPLGTVVYDADTGKYLGEVVNEGSRIVVARGGRGGRGNAAFATRNYRVPRFAEKGESGRERWIKLELKSIAHVGLIGLPNAGKSTFLASVTAAKPKIADYPFTTVSPNLGVIEAGPGLRYIFADIPGLIEGAADGAGLGHKFLKHISRTKMLLHLIDLSMVDPSDPLTDFNIIMNELQNYSESLREKTMIVAGNKTDIVGTEEACFALEKALEDINVRFFPISAAGGEGIKELTAEIFNDMKTLGDDFITEEIPREDFVIVDEESESLKQFEVKKVEDYYVVTGKSPERMVAMTYLDNEEAVWNLQQRLKRMGIEEKLQEIGARDGDTVVIGEFEFFFNKEKELS